MTAAAVNGHALTVQALADAKRRPAETLAELGVHDLPQGGVGMTYFDADRRRLFIRERESPRRGRRFWQPAGVKVMAYGLWRLDEAAQHGFLVVVEGESDAWVLWHHGLPALGIPGASTFRNALTAEVGEVLEGIPTIYIACEQRPDGSPDTGAVAFVPGVRARLAELGYRGRVFELRCPDQIKDLADLHAQDPGRFLERFRAALEGSSRLDAAGEPPRQTGKADARPAPRYSLITSADFARADYRPEWLIRRLVVRGQPAIVGGPKKGLKTSLMVDLALSLGTGGAFLGEFEVARPLRVALLSGESGQSTLQETALRIAAAKGIDLAAADVLWGFELPQLADVAHLATLSEALERAKAKVLVYDPLYLGLLSGEAARGLSASNLFDMGPLLLAITQACQAVGCTPILAHHFRQTRADPLGEPQLDDLAFAGVQEFARQWLLVSRRKKYQPGTGSHRLWLSAGGSAGQSGLWALDIDEGVLGEDFGGRRWEVSLTTPSEARASEQDLAEAAHKEERDRREQEDKTALMRAIDQLTIDGPSAAGYTQARELSGLSAPRMQRAVARLKSQRVLEVVPITVSVGSGARRQASGLRRVMEAD